MCGDLLCCGKQAEEPHRQDSRRVLRRTDKHRGRVGREDLVEGILSKSVGSPWGNLKLGSSHTIRLIFLLLLMFNFEKEHERGGGAEREEDRGSEAGSLLTAASLMWDLNSRTRRS